MTQLIAGQPSPAAVHDAFVEEVHTSTQERRDPRIERLICGCWVLIAVKHVLIIWAVVHYHVPVHQLAINFPTWLLGVLATTIYYSRTRRT